MKIGIIGAGFGGMAAAFDLKNAGHEVVIFEAADSVGGLASGFKEPYWDWSVEKFYHHWFQSDSSMMCLMDELGLRDKVIFPRPLTVMLYKGKWYPFDSIVKALLFPGLGFGLNKIRFGFVGLFLRLTNNWRALEKLDLNLGPRRQVIGRVAKRFGVQSYLIVCFGVHKMMDVAVGVEVLHLVVFQRRPFDILGGAEPNFSGRT